MQRNQVSKRTQNLTITGLLTAIGIFIPLIMPFKVVIGPASFTLGSHVPVDMSMFRKPSTAAIVAVGTTIGFLMAGFPIIIVARALTHLIFATLGAYYLQKAPNTLVKTGSRTAFNCVINTIHGLGEVAIVYALTTAGVVPPSDGFMYTLIVLIGIGTLIHGMIDFEIAYQITKAIEKRAHLGFAQVAL
ncbi:hypothetical protein ACN7UQ_00095 [Aerococcus urinaeequi]|uniref:hypothetical protein n=1 Tax=Aerococcus urinaeequi TaxID=51665 RepID=UPI003B3AE628